MASGPSIKIKQVDGYKFTVDFGQLLPELLADEPEPIGTGEGPSPEQLLVASVANCLCASLVFALGKYKQEGGGVQAEASCRVERNEERRLRIQNINVEISLGALAADLRRLDQVLAQFERFCTVSESVKAGIPITVSVHDDQGKQLK